MGALVSVIISTYNYGQYVCQAVDSALAQTYKDIEVLVVDDGSTDDTREHLAQYGGRIRYIYQEHKERSAARNTGIRNARGKYLAFLDADDIWLPQKLEFQVPILDQAPEVGLVYCWAYFINPSGQRIVYNGKDTLRGLAAGSRVFEQLLFENVITASGSTAVIRRECVDKVGMFDESLPYAEDQDLWMRITLHYQIAVVTEALVCYRRYDISPHQKYKRKDYFVSVAKKRCSYLLGRSDVSEALKRKALSHAHWKAAMDCHLWSQDNKARHHLVQAVVRDVGLLHNNSVLNMFVELILGKKLSNCLRELKRRVRNGLHKKNPARRFKCAT